MVGCCLVLLNTFGGVWGKGQGAYKGVFPLLGEMQRILLISICMAMCRCARYTPTTDIAEAAI